MIRALGYALLVLLAVLAPTPLPIPLDGIILGLIRLGYNPFWVFPLAFIGDVVGTALIFILGQKGRSLLANYRRKRRQRDYVLAQNLFHSHGKYALLLSGTPFLGDALIFMAGFYRLPPRVFVFWFVLGKALWYLALLISAKSSALTFLVSSLIFSSMSNFASFFK